LGPIRPKDAPFGSLIRDKIGAQAAAFRCAGSEF
jgi:hypothetical protein